MIKNNGRDEMKLRGLTNQATWKNKNLLKIFLLIVFLILFKPPIVETIGKLFRCTFFAITDIRSFQLNLTTPRTGEHILPPAVQEMLALLRRHQIISYNISGKIMNDPTLHQRIVESAWPRRMSPESNYKFIFISELDNSSNCIEIERRKEVALVFCR